MHKKKYCGKNRYKSFIICLFILLLLSFAGADTLCRYKNIFYEYNNINKDPDKTPLVVCVPGFSQHNFSLEFLIIKDYFTRKNFSYLIMNPPLHGKKTVSICKKIFTFGNKEAQYLKHLIYNLKVWENHNEIHLLGFSLGARAVLKFSAQSKSKCKKSFKIDSVIAIATPFSIVNLNGRLSGDILHPFESIISMFQAVKRSSLLRLLTMLIGGGISDAILCGYDSPAMEMSRIKSPVLLIHGADDWLVKSYHSLKLFDYADEDQPVAVAILNTRAHAEDIISLHNSRIRQAFFKVIDKWFVYIKSGCQETRKKTFNDKFEKELKCDCILHKSLFDSGRITRMSSPIFNNLNTNIWVSPVYQNPSLFTINSTFSLKGGEFSRYFFTLGSTGTKSSLLDKIMLGLSFEKQMSNRGVSDFELYTTIYRPLGAFTPFLYVRRLTYIQGIGNSFNRGILSADISLFRFNFRLNYGKFFPLETVGGRNVWQIELHMPLINDVVGSYYLGLSYSRFLSPVPDFIFESNLKAYLFLGPGFKIAGARLRGHVQVEQDGWHIKGAKRLYSAGLSVNFAE